MAVDVVGRVAVLREREFRVFFAGYVTSALGSGMAAVALAFAVLEGRGSVADLSYVLAARILPMVLFLLAGGLLGDRLPRRQVMLTADAMRAAGTAGIAALFLLDAPVLWLLLALSAVVGLGEALFTPCLEGLVPALVPTGRLGDANAMLGLARSTANVAGPALAGILVALIGSATVLAVDAATFGASVVALALLRVPGAVPALRTRSLLADLRQGWDVFRSYTWLWVITTQAALFNLLVIAPYLVLGPAAAQAGYSGASAWGAIMTGYGAGAVLGGLALLGRRPRRPLVVSTIAGFGYAVPPACLVLTLPLPVVVAGAVAAGVGSAVGTALLATTVQQRIPSEALSRVNSYLYLGAFALGPIGLAAAGPIAEATSIGLVLGVGVLWQLAANTLVLALPAIRDVRRPEPADTDTDAGAGAGRASASSAGS